MTGNLITRDNLPDNGWRDMQKLGTTQVRRMQGPFSTMTREGAIDCPDGYLAVDSGGWPYPIAKDECERIYRPSVDPRYEESTAQREQRERSHTYHAPRTDQIDRYQLIRQSAAEFALILNKSCPPSRELSIAQTKLDELVMWANKAIACNEPPA